MGCFSGRHLSFQSLHQAAFNVGGQLLLLHALVYLHCLSGCIDNDEAIGAFIDVNLPLFSCLRIYQAVEIFV